MYITQTVLPKQVVPPLDESDFNHVWSLEKNFKIIKRYNDPRFGDITVMQNSSNQVILAKEKLASNKNEAAADIYYLKNRMNINHDNIMKILDYSSQVNKELCSTTFITKAFFEFPKTDLLRELSERKKNAHDFSHIELTHLVYQILLGLEHIHKKELAHGDIKPQLIGYDKFNNHFKILDRLNDMSLIERYQINQIINGKDIYVSPDLYKKIKSKNKNAQVDYYKNDIFALGLTLLYIGNGTSVQNIYLNNGEIEHRSLHEHVMNFDIKYNDQNPFLCNLLKTLLQMKDNDRPSASLLFDNIPSYEEFKRSEVEGNFALEMSSHVKNEIAPHEYNIETNTRIYNAPQYQNHYVQSTPKQFYDNQNYPHTQDGQFYDESKIINNTTKQVQNGNKNMQFYDVESYFDANGNKMIRRSYGNDTKVEVKRASPSPVKNKVIKKRYVMREDGTVVEIDPNIDLNSTDIKKYFNGGKDRHTIGHYNNVNHAMNTEPKQY